MLAEVGFALAVCALTYQPVCFQMGWTRVEPGLSGVLVEGAEARDNNKGSPYGPTVFPPL